MPNMLLDKSREIAPEGMKRLSRSRNNAKLWMCLVVKVKVLWWKEQYCIGTWNVRSMNQGMWRADSLEKTLMLGRTGGRRRSGRQRMRWLDGITDSMNIESEWTLGVSDGQGGLVCCDSWGCKELDTTERLNRLTDAVQVASVMSYSLRPRGL